LLPAVFHAIGRLEGKLITEHPHYCILSYTFQLMQTLNRPMYN